MITDRDVHTTDKVAQTGWQGRKEVSREMRCEAVDSEFAEGIGQFGHGSVSGTDVGGDIDCQSVGFER